MYYANIVGNDCGPLAISQSLQECAEMALLECEIWGDEMLSADITAEMVVIRFADHLSGNIYTVICKGWPLIAEYLVGQAINGTALQG